MVFWGWRGRSWKRLAQPCETHRDTETHRTGTHLSLSEGACREHTRITHFAVTAASCTWEQREARDGPRAGAALTPLHQLETGRGGVLRSSSLLRTAATYEKRHNTE